jgi:hypothetical protein
MDYFRACCEGTWNANIKEFWLNDENVNLLLEKQNHDKLTYYIILAIAHNNYSIVEYVLSRLDFGREDMKTFLVSAVDWDRIDCVRKLLYDCDYVEGYKSILHEMKGYNSSVFSTFNSSSEIASTLNAFMNSTSQPLK